MSGPVFAHGQLRLYLLALLEREPQHGYDVIKALSDQFGGTYRPSPGTIYPRLARLEEEGLIAKDKAGRKAVYRITDAGRAELDSRRDELAETEGDIALSVRERADELRRETLADADRLRTDLAPGGRRRLKGSVVMEHQLGGTRPDPAVAQGGLDIGEQVMSRARLREAETLVTLFRAEVRAELRLRAAHGALSQETLDALRVALDEVLARFKAPL